MYVADEPIITVIAPLQFEETDVHWMRPCCRWAGDNHGIPMDASNRFTPGLAVVSAILLLRYRINSAWLVLGGGIAGIAAQFPRL